MTFADPYAARLRAECSAAEELWHRAFTAPQRPAQRPGKGNGGRPDMSAEYRRLHREGKSNQDIARTLGVKIGTVWQNLSRLGLKANRRAQ